MAVLGRLTLSAIVRVVACLALVAAVVQAQAAPAAAAPEDGTLSASPNGSVIVKEQVVLTGSLPPARSRPLTLERRTGTGAWTAAGTSTSTATGAFTFTVTMPAKVNQVVRYRVLAPQARLGGTTYPAVQTPDVTLRTVAQAAALALPSPVLVGSSYTATATFTPARQGRPVVLQRRQGTSWVAAGQATQSAAGSASFTLQATATGTVTYRVISKKYLGAPQVASPQQSVTITTGQDTTPPPVPTGLTSTGGDGQASLSWSPVIAADLDGYRVYRAASETGPWTAIGDTDEEAFDATGLANGTLYWFAVASLDALGNESARSAPVSARPADQTPPPAVTLQSATPGDGEVDLAWDPSPAADLASYRIYQATSPGGPYQRVATDVAGTAHTVDGLANGSTYWFRVTGVDQAGNESDPSASLPATPADTTAPAVVEDLAATAGDSRVSLAWAPVDDADLAGYHVYQGASATGPWTRLTSQPVADPAFEAAGLENGVTAHFAVTSVDEAGNESAYSDSAQATPRDLTAPPSPTEPTTHPGDRKVTLSWGGQIPPDLVGFHVYVADSADGPWQRVTDDPIASPPYDVLDLANGTAYWFAVTAVDAAGNESARSGASTSTPRDNVPPPVPSGVQAVGGDGSVTVSWDAVSDPGLVGYHVYRGTSETGPWTQLNFTPTTDTSLTDSSAVNGTAYWYSVTSRDNADNHSVLAPPVQATPGDTTPPPVPVGLVAARGDAQVTLTWSAVAAGDLAGYRVYQALSPNGPWTEAGTLGSATTRVVGGLTNGTLHYFAVTSVDDAGNESERSGWASARPADTTPPAVPTGLTATAGDTEVRLDWAAVDDPDFVTYRVYQAPSATGPWTSVRYVGQQTATIGGLANFTEVFFSVSAIDGSNNESARSGAVPATPTNPEVQPIVDAGAQFTCRLKANGSIWCWGLNSHGQLGIGTLANPQHRSAPVQVGTDTHWVSLSTGWAHSCAIKTNGSLWCWGDNESGQLGDGNVVDRSTPVRVGTGTDWAQVDAGGSTTCALKVDHTLWCWGANTNGQLGDGTTTDRRSPTQVGSAADWASVTTTIGTTCGLKTDDTAWCWGYGGQGQLGNGASVDSLTPVPVSSTIGWRELSGGSWNLCGVKTDGTAWCWGYGGNGQLGSDTFLSNVPIQVGSGSDWSNVSAFQFHSCGVKTDGSGWCWGINSSGQLGNGTRVNSTQPTRVAGDTTWVRIAAGYEHTCGLTTSGGAACFGVNEFGTLGNGHSFAEPTPLPIASPPAWDQVSTGAWHSCGIAADESLWCWGLASGGRLGDGSSVSDRGPQQVDAGAWRQVAAGGSHSCAVKADHTAWCWGANIDGQLGTAGGGTQQTPVQLGAAADWDAVAVGLGQQPGQGFSCGLKVDGTIWCWGANGKGQLGDGTTTSRPTPAQVGADSDWATITAGSAHVCATKDDGTAWCWGGNANGQLGDGTVVDRSTPTQVGAATGWTSVSAGDRHSCGVRAGTLWCWGANESSQLGDGTGTSRLLPTQVAPAVSTWTSVAAGFTHSCAVRANGTLWCWGDGSAGSLGIGTLPSSPAASPVQVGTGTTWTSVSASQQVTCGIAGDAASCWGRNSFGQLGTTLAQATPVAVVG